jgi:hypothetical protein
MEEKDDDQPNNCLEHSNSGNQEIRCILRIPKVHCRIYKSPPLVHTLSQTDQVHTLPSYLLKIYRFIQT